MSRYINNLADKVIKQIIREATELNEISRNKKNQIKRDAINAISGDEDNVKTFLIITAENPMGEKASNNLIKLTEEQLEYVAEKAFDEVLYREAALMQWDNDAITEQEIEKTEEPNTSVSHNNRVVVENGEVKTIIESEYLTLEEARRLTLEVIEKEYELP